MKRTIAALLVCVPLTATAKPAKHGPPGIAINGDRAPALAQGASGQDVTRSVRERRKARPRARQRGYVPVPRSRPVPGFVSPLAGVVGPLAAKTREITAACGSRVISAIRYTRIAGTGGRLSLHASGRAVDIVGNPRCIYSHLRHWPGGYSVDYGRVKHVHISYAPGGPEFGVRFNHYRGGKRKRARG